MRSGLQAMDMETTELIREANEAAHQLRQSIKACKVLHRLVRIVGHDIDLRLRQLTDSNGKQAKLVPTHARQR